MRTIKLTRSEFIGNWTYMETEIVEVDDERARRLVRSGAAEYVEPKAGTDEVEFATLPETENKETMTLPKRRKRKGEE